MHRSRHRRPRSSQLRGRQLPGAVWLDDILVHDVDDSFPHDDNFDDNNHRRHDNDVDDDHNRTAHYDDYYCANDDDLDDNNDDRISNVGTVPGLPDPLRRIDSRECLGIL
jgi:hypothetical protein